MLAKNRQKRILYYTHSYLFAGCENLLVNLINSKVINNNYEIFFAYRHSNPYQDGVDKKINKNVNKIPLRLLDNARLSYALIMKNIKPSLPAKLIFRLFEFFRKKGFYNIYNIFRLYLLFKKIKPDLLHINNGGYPAADSCRIAVISAKIAGIKRIVFTVNNMAAKQISMIDKMLDDYIANNVDCFTTASNAARLNLSEARKFDLKNILNIPNTLGNESKIKSARGVLRHEFNVNDDTLILGSVGLLTRRKGYDVLINALGLLKEQYHLNNVKCFIIGEGEDRTNLAEQIKSRKLEGIVFLIGYRDNIWEYIKDFDVFILPSRSSEDLPYVILEAMLLGKPVIGTKVAGIPEQIDNGETGIIVDPEDYNSIACAINVILANKEKLIAMGKNGRDKYLNKFRYEYIINQYNKLYGQLLARSAQ